MKIKYTQVLRSASKIALLLCILSFLGLGIFFTYKSLKYKPYKVRVSNVTDSAFTVSWVTDEPMVGVVYYGEKDSFLPGPLAWIGQSKAVDDRDVSNAQTECVSDFNKKASKTKDANFTVSIEGYDCNDVKVVKRGEYYTHHVTVQNLEAEKEYYFRVGDGYISYAKGKTDGVEYIEREMPAIEVFSQKTLPIINDVSSPNPAYGTSSSYFYSNSGQLGRKKSFDSVIFLKTFKDSFEFPLMSAVSNADGGWSIDLSNVRTPDGKSLEMTGSYVEFIPQVENAKPGASGAKRYEDSEYPLNLMGKSEEDWGEDKSVSAESVSYLKNIFVRDIEAADPIGGASCYCVSKNCTYVKKSSCSGACMTSQATCQGQLEDKTPAVVEIPCYKCNGASLETKYFDKNKGCGSGYSPSKPNCSTPTTNQITCWNSEGKSKKVNDTKCPSDYPHTDLPKNCCTYNASTISCSTCNKPCTGTNLTESACKKKVEENSEPKKVSCWTRTGMSTCTSKEMEKCPSGTFSSEAACKAAQVEQCECVNGKQKYRVVGGGGVSQDIATNPFNPFIPKAYAQSSPVGTYFYGGSCDAGEAKVIPVADYCNPSSETCVTIWSKVTCQKAYIKEDSEVPNEFTGTEPTQQQLIDCTENLEIAENLSTAQQSVKNRCAEENSLSPAEDAHDNARKISIVSYGCGKGCAIEYRNSDGTLCGNLPVTGTACPDACTGRKKLAACTDICDTDAGCVCPSTGICENRLVNKGELCMKADDVEDGSLLREGGTVCKQPFCLCTYEDAPKLLIQKGEACDGIGLNLDSLRVNSSTGKCNSGKSPITCYGDWDCHGEELCLSSCPVLYVDDIRKCAGSTAVLVGSLSSAPVKPPSLDDNIDTEVFENSLIKGCIQTSKEQEDGQWVTKYTNISVRTEIIAGGCQQGSCYMAYYTADGTMCGRVEVSNVFCAPASCNHNVPIRECNEDSDCSNGNKCSPSYTCVGCLSNDDCSNNQKCVENSCQSDGASLSSNTNDRELAQTNPLTFKTIAQGNNNGNIGMLYLPESGIYKVETGTGDVYLMGGEEWGHSFYYERNGIEGYQEPRNPNNPETNEDLMVDQSAVVLQTSQVTTSTELNLKEGINIISFNFVPSFGENNPMTSTEFLKFVNQYSNVISRISYFSAGQWNGGTSYDFESKEAKGAEFVLSPGKGYLILAEKDAKVSVPSLGLESPVPIAFSSGWNLVGVHGYDTAYTAKSFLNSVNTIEGLKANNITYWPTSRGMYQGFQLSEGQAYGQDYPITKDLGYFVRISEFNAPNDTCKSIIWNPGGDLNGKCGSGN